jgi:hypothetical protein
MLSIRALMWGCARLGESAATLYTRSPGNRRGCDNTTCLDIARWCAVRTRDRAGLLIMRDDAISVVDGRTRVLLQKRLAFFE